MTEPLFATDAGVRVFHATVTDLDAETSTLVLDRTAFYPGGGGQPCDHGTLVVEGREVAVTKVRRAGSAITHQVEEIGVFTVGAEVEGRLDWERRYALMRTHTALHVLCGVVWRDWGAQVTGGNMEPGAGRMDFEFERMSKELVADIEQRCNVEVAAERDVRVAILPRAEAFAIPDLIRTKINLLPEGIQEIRTVEIVGLDLQADGGTHVANTREIGQIRVTNYKSKGRTNKRIHLVVE